MQSIILYANETYDRGWLRLASPHLLPSFEPGRRVTFAPVATLRPVNRSAYKVTRHPPPECGESLFPRISTADERSETMENTITVSGREAALRDVGWTVRDGVGRWAAADSTDPA